MDSDAPMIDESHTQQPSLDVAPLETLDRLTRLASLADAHAGAVLGAHGLQTWEFDVLAALRRAGAPHELTPGQLVRATRISSGTTTHRIQGLERRGLVTRTRDEHDRRVVRVRLTADGLATFDAARVAHLADQRQLLDRLDASDLEALRVGLSALADAWEQHQSDVPPGDHA